MSDLISRQAAMDAIEKHKGLTNVAKLEAMNQILTIPSAEPVHGKWIKVKRKEDLEMSYLWYIRCSNCGTTGSYSYKYCPFCGAKNGR